MIFIVKVCLSSIPKPDSKASAMQQNVSLPNSCCNNQRLRELLTIVCAWLLKRWKSVCARNQMDLESVDPLATLASKPSTMNETESARALSMDSM